MNYKLIAMDLDGTLTQHKSKLEQQNTDLLYELKSKYALVMLGAGGCQRIYEQMNCFPIDIVGNYGIQESTVENGNFKIIRNDVYSVDKSFFENTVTQIRKETGYTNFVGQNVEFHQSGLVTFPLLGTGAKLEDKLAFDPDGKKRTEIYDLVASSFSDYNCFIGGTSSFDISAKQYNKYNALVKYIAEKGISKESVLFIGDDFKKGGNDEHAMLGGVDCINIDNYKNTANILKQKGII